jgi:hypothetical protein
MRILLPLFFGSILAAQTVTTNVMYVSNTQAIVHVIASGPASPYACIYTASEGSLLGAPVNDVNPTLFPGSNTESRPSASVIGNNHYFVFGTRTYQQATTKQWVSRALQAYTTHTYQVTCGSAAPVGGTFTTANIPLGESYPEPPPIDKTAYHNLALPTIDFTPGTGQDTTYYDAMTGIQIKRVTGPLGNVVSAGNQRPLSYAQDLSGGGWSNVSNAITNQVPATLASTSSVGARLFVSWNVIDPASAPSWGTEASPYDLRMRWFGYGPGGPTMQQCITFDSHTCASAIQSFTLPAGASSSAAATVVAPNAGYPAPMFASWQPFTLPPSLALLANGSANGPEVVNVNGSTVTWVSGPVSFLADWQVGATVQIAGGTGGGACPGGISTITSVSDYSMTIANNCGSATGATLQYLGAGVLVWMSSGTSAYLSATYDAMVAGQTFGVSTNGSVNACNFNPITDISTDRFGNPTPVQTGYMCQLLGEQLFIPLTGEMRTLSDLYNNGVGFMSPIPSSFYPTDAKSTVITNSANDDAYQATLTASGTYLELEPTTYPPIDSVISYTDLTVTTTPIEAQLEAFGGYAASAYAACCFPAPVLSAAIDGYLYYYSSPGQDHAAVIIKADATNNLVQAYTTWNQYPGRWGVGHFSPEGTSSYAYVGINAMLQFDGNMGGPFPLTITGMYHGGVLESYTLPITGFTNGPNPEATVSGISLDPYFNANFNFGPCAAPSTTCGPTVKLGGGTGPWAAANGTVVANVPSTGTTDQNDFTVPALNTSTFGPYPGGMTVTATPPLINSNVTNIANSSPPVVTTAVTVGVRPLNNGLLDGDSIEFSNLPGIQYFAHVLTPSTFSVYTDSALTIPASYAAMAGAISGAVHFVEQCPAGLPTLVTSGMLFDSTGSVGLRCITVRVASEPCDRWATAAEAAAYPPAQGCPAGGSTLQNLAVGDAIQDIARAQTDEKLVVVQITPLAGGAMELTLMRFFGNLITSGGYDTIASNTSGASHDTGWTAFPVPSLAAGWSGLNGYVNILDPTDTLVPMNPDYGQCHSDLGYGYPVGNYTIAGGCFNSISNVPFSAILTANPANTFNNSPFFAGGTASQLSYSNNESYPGHRQYLAQAGEMVWKTDHRAFNPDWGTGVTQGSEWIGNSSVPLLVPGTQHVYLIPLTGGTTIDIKTSPLWVFAGNRVFWNKSGPISRINDDDVDAFCHAYNAGECVPGSAVNNIYVSGKNLDVTRAGCWTDTYNMDIPCAVALNANGGWNTQEQISPVDTAGSYMRRLSYGLAAPGLHFSFQTQLLSPDGSWSFFAAPYVNGLRSDYYAMKLPPWPANQVNVTARNNFIPISIPIAGRTGANQADIEFGYAEDGPPNSFFCVYRQEPCITDIPSAHPADPYAFMSEPVSSYTPCSSGCTVSIPAIPSRTVYYKIRYLNSGQVVATTSMRVAMAPPQFYYTSEH